MPAAAAAPFLTADGVPTALGERWNHFQLRAVYPGARHSFLAEDVGQMEKVLISARPIQGAIDWRRRAWAQLSALESLQTLRCREAIEADGWRYEIMAAPPPMNLQEWIAAHRPGLAEVEVLMRQLSETLGALHAEGLVHLNLRPETIHIEEGKGGLEYWLGGLQEVTLFNQPDLIPIEVDPFYAPPEAAGLTRHSPGPTLCAWDWWSLGRVVQQFLIGGHVLGLILNRDVSVPTPELRMRAELLLQEKEPPAVRAGAVEQMEVEPAALPLLRGLLTGSSDARWRKEAVQRWLQHETVPDYYDLPRTARLWSLGEQVFTIHAAAEYFTRPANWAQGEEMLLNTEQPGTLANFLNQTPAYRSDWDRLRTVRELAESPAWAEVPSEARRTMTAAIAWLVLSATGGGRAIFRVRGQAMDNSGLTHLLKSPGGSESVMLFRALLNPSVLEYVEALDPGSGRMLQSVIARGGVALKAALENGWLHPTDSAGFIRLFTLSLERMGALQERVHLLHASYATSRHPELARLLSSRTLTPPETVILVFTGEMPDQCGYVTHADARNERYHLLKSEVDRIAVMLAWLRLHQLLRIGRLWGLPWPIYAAIAGGVIGIVALFSRSETATIVVTAALLFSRLWLWQRVKDTFRRAVPQAKPWSWRDGYERTTAEVGRITADVGVAGIAGFPRQLQALQSDMAGFAAEARRAPPVAVPSWWDLAGVMVISAVVVVVALLQSISSVHEALRGDEPVVVAAPKAAVALPVLSRVENPDRSVAIEQVADPASLLATGRYEVVDDGFGRRLRGPLKKWDSFSPAQVEPLAVEARAVASPEQAAFAVVSATLALQPYLRDSISALVAVRVPTTRGTGLLLFNARDRQLLEREVLLVSRPLKELTWYELDGRRVLYVGSALPLDATISLAPP